MAQTIGLATRPYGPLGHRATKARLPQTRATRHSISHRRRRTVTIHFSHLAVSSGRLAIAGKILESMRTDPEFDVVIVGFGPAGAVAACWLGQAGIRTLVVEKSRTIWEIPRAMALDHEILRVFQNIGVVEHVLPHTAPFGASEHYGAEGQLIRSIGVVPAALPSWLFPEYGIYAAAR